TALCRPAIECSGGIALHVPRPNTWPLNIRRLGRFRPYRPSDSLRLAVSPPFATYRRTSFSSASTIRGCIATADRQWRLQEFDGSPNLGRLFRSKLSVFRAVTGLEKRRRSVIT